MKRIYDYKIIKPQPLTLSKKIISSTYIRSLLENGDLKKANKLLSRIAQKCNCSKGKTARKKNWFPNMQYRYQRLCNCNARSICG